MNSDQIEPRRTKFHPATLVAGALLMLAAGAKAWQNATQRDSFTWLLVLCEFLLGVWLLSGVAHHWARRAGIIIFGAFAVASLHKGIIGDRSCGCFGAVEVDPWISLSLDLLLVGWLLLGEFTRSRLRIVSAVIISIALVLGLVAATVQWWEPLILRDGARTQRQLLDPRQWVGQRLPFEEEVLANEAILSGRWWLVIYRKHCGECKVVLPRFEQLARRGESVALLELPPYDAGAEDPVPAGTACLRLKLQSEINWFVFSPTVLEMSDGIVVQYVTPEQAARIQ